MTATIDYDRIASARALIADRDHWIKGAYAKDAKGLPVDDTDADAVNFCMIGAMFHAGIKDKSPEFDAVVAALPRCSNGSIALFNDDPTRFHSDVLGIFDKVLRKRNPTRIGRAFSWIKKVLS